MPLRGRQRDPEPLGPKPFSSEWATRPPDQSPAPRRRIAPWKPARRDQRWLSAAVVLLMVGLAALLSGGQDLRSAGPGGDSPGIPAIEQDGGEVALADPTATSPPAIADETPVVAIDAPTAIPAAPEPTATSTPTATAADVDMSEAILPTYRVLSYYGFPGEPRMGILGEHEPERLLELLREQAAAYEQADPTRPVMLAFEVIASVAQASPGADGDYLAYIGTEALQRYIDFTAENDLLLILDVQFGRKTVQEEVEAMRPYLQYPHVHLALDPEFAVGEGQVPGTVIGSIDAADVQWALEEMAAISREAGIPPKMLIVHQFTEKSITNRDQIRPVPGVQFVLEVDGFGAPDAKRETYRFITAGDPAEFYGFKLWYQQDVPLMTPGEVISLVPSPDLIIYQ